MEKILVLHREPTVRQQLHDLLRVRGYEVATVASAAEAQALLHRAQFDLVFFEMTDIDSSAREWMRDGGFVSTVPVAVMVAPAVVLNSVPWLEAGVFEILSEPIDHRQLDAVLTKASLQLRRVQIGRLAGSHARRGDGALLGESRVVNNLRQLIRKVARTDATVLIQGEPGSGKSAVARELHLQSARHHQPLLIVPCDLCGTTTEDERWSKDTLTAHTEPTKALLLAHGGTMLLDEVGELSSEAQSRLLETLRRQDNNDSDARYPDVRLFATTSRALEAQANGRAFNEQLYYRLNIMPVYVAPLRERKDDLPHLAEYYRQRAVRKYGKNVLAIAPEGVCALQDYAWPGNIRELRDVIDRAIWTAKDGAVLDAESFQLPGSVKVASLPLPAVQSLYELEKHHIFAVLRQCSHNRTHSARILGISIRTLRNKLREYRQQQNGAPLEIDLPVGAFAAGASS